MNNFKFILILTGLLFGASCTAQGSESSADFVNEWATLPPLATDDVVPTFPPPLPTQTLVPPATLTAVPTNEPPTPSPTDPPPTATPANGDAATSFGLQRVTGGFFKPLGLEHAGDDRLFVVQQPGVISVVENGSAVAVPFLDIVDRVNSNANEQGLLGLAFHPDYATNGRFFVNYTAADNSTVIAEFAVSPDNANRADPDSEKVLLNVDQPYRNHNGGQLTFGPDGYLYIGLGDGGSADDPLNAGQDGQNLLGSMLRIDVAQEEGYAIPPNNPFVGNDSVRDEIWAKGLRNPWRFSFDRQTGDLFIADVGQNQYEEVNFEPAGSPGGLNYGWRIFEGSHCYIGDCGVANLTAPIAEYSHGGEHCSVTGGYVYRGNDFPNWRGNYFMADYCSGVVWSVFQHEDGRWEQTRLGSVGFLVSSFGEDVNGELYVLNQVEGAIYRLVP